MTSSIWDNKAEGIFAFTCQHETGNLTTAACWNLRINMIFSIIFLFPLLYQLKQFAAYYGGFFRTRQRMGYLCLISSILTIFNFTIMSVVGVALISAYILQVIFFKFMSYLISKIANLTSNWISMIMHAINGINLLGITVHLILSLRSTNVNERVAECHAFLDQSYPFLKITILISWILLYIFSARFLTTLLSRCSDFYISFEQQKKKARGILKMRTATAIVTFSQISHVIILRVFFNPGPGSVCVSGDSDLKANLIVFFYRMIRVYLPFYAIIWLTWVGETDIEPQFSDPFSESGIETSTHFASNLAYSQKKLLPR